MSRELAITSEVSFNTATVLFNGIPHLFFLRKEVIGLQSWKSRTQYVLELTFKSGAVLTLEYDRRDLWQKVAELIVDIAKDAD